MTRPLFPSKEDFINTYLKVILERNNCRVYEDSFWASEMMREIIEQHENEALDLIREIFSRNQTAQVMQHLAAGPLEDLLCEHNYTIIYEIERIAKEDPMFCKLLGGVWKNRMPDDIWNRVQNVWDRRGWDGIPEK